MTLSSRMTDEVSVETYEGEGAYGPVLLPAKRFRVRVDGERVLVRDAQGDEVVSEMRLITLPRLRELDTSERYSATDVFTVESNVIVGEYRTTVIGRQEFRGRGRMRYLQVTLA